MEKRSRKIARRNGFTAIETVVSVVVLAILAAYATPKLFGLKEQADATEETLKIKDIEARHTQEILKAGKRGVNPTLGDVVGFRPEVTAEPAPDTAPMLVDWTWRRTILTEPRHLRTSNLQQSTAGYMSPSIFGDLYLKCKDVPLHINPLAVNGYTRGYQTNELWDSYSGSFTETTNPNMYYRLNSFTATQLGPSEAVPASEPAPKCDLFIDVYKFTVITGSYPQDPLFGNMRGVRTHVVTNATTYSLNGGSEIYSSWEEVSGGTAYHHREGTPSATHFSYDCSPYSQRYGVKYVIRNVQPWGSGVLSTSNGLEKSATYMDSVSTSGAFTHYNSSGVGVVASSTTWLTNTFNGKPDRNGYCERVGPPPEAPPSDPGNPGIYPMAADGSGYCLSPGRKLPTYKDSTGTPTSSASDSVVELATEAVDDPANCPG